MEKKKRKKRIKKKERKKRKKVVKRNFRRLSQKIGGLVLVLQFVSIQRFMTNSYFIVCTFWGGLMSGLTVGLLSIDELELELKQFTGTE